MGHPRKYLTCIPQPVKVIKSKKSLKGCHPQDKPKDTWQPNVRWCHGWDPGTEKGQYAKSKAT